MNDAKKVVPLRPDPEPRADDGRMIVTMTAVELREMIRAEINVAMVSKNTTDRLLDVKDAAATLSISEEWIYHNAKKLPFARKIGGTLRFSMIGIQKWMESKRP